MTTEPRAALDAFIAALERHLSLATSRGGSGDTALRVAGERVGETFIAYDEALFDTYREATPLDLYEDDDEDDFDDDLDGDDGDEDDFDDYDDDLAEDDDDLDDDDDDDSDDDDSDDDDSDDEDGRN